MVQKNLSASTVLNHPGNANLFFSYIKDCPGRTSGEEIQEIAIKINPSTACPLPLTIYYAVAINHPCKNFPGKNLKKNTGSG
ncbi:MAG: hypothetical protein WAW23_04850 [Candidatus Methanoperedens sp.]